MKICIDCRQQKAESEFSRKGKDFQCRCRVCFAAYHRVYYAKNKDKYIAKNRLNKKRQRERLRKILWSFKQTPCQDCGGVFHPWVMELDHRENTEKIEAVSNLVGRGCTDQKLLVEIKKCDVVCANCHRMRTYYRMKAKNVEVEEIL